MEIGARHFQRSKDEIHRVGRQWFETKIEPLDAGRDKWDSVAIAAETGDFGVDKGPLAVTERLLARRPAAEIWARRVVFPFHDRFGLLSKRRPVALRWLPNFQVSIDVKNSDDSVVCTFRENAFHPISQSAEVRRLIGAFIEP